MDNLTIVVLVAALLAGGVAVWSVRTRTKALGAQRALYESALSARDTRYAKEAEQHTADYGSLTGEYEEKHRQYAALVATHRAVRDEADSLRQYLGERDLRIADLAAKLSRDWRGEVKIRCIRHRGKGGTLPLHEERLQINGPDASFRFQSPHPNGDIYDFGFELHLGQDGDA